MKITITLMLLLTLALTGHAGSVPQPPPLPPQLQVWGWALGNWQCSGDYRDVPGVTQAHHVEANFHVGLAVGGNWLEGHYVEFSSTPGLPLQAIDDYFTVDTLTGLGIRSFLDHNPGQFSGGYTFPALSTVDFTGRYTVHGLEVGYHEILARGQGDASFTTDSRVVLPGPDGNPLEITFHTQTCHRLAS